MFELLFAEGMFAINLNFRKGFAWRFPLGLALCFGLSFAFPYTVGGSIYYSLIFIGMFCLTLAMGALCFDAPMKNILFCATGALMSPTSQQQGLAIPGICHVVQLTAK